MRVIIVGSRDFDDFLKLAKSCNDILSEAIRSNDDLEYIRIISGDARGADRLGEKYAEAIGYEVSRFPADWAGLGKRAGYVRNAEMARFATADGNCGMLIAFWDGKSRGTKHMISLAREYGMNVRIVRF